MNGNEIKEYNKRLSSLKANVQRLEMQIEMQEKSLNEKLQSISNLVGEQVTAENLEAYYQKISAELENQLANGLAILDSISGNGAAVANNYATQQPVQSNMNMQAGNNQMFAQNNMAQATMPQAQAPVQNNVQNGQQFTQSGLSGIARQFGTQPATNNGFGSFGSSNQAFANQQGLDINILGV